MGDSEEQGSLACYSSWSHKESDTATELTHKFLDSSLGDVYLDLIPKANATKNKQVELHQTKKPLDSKGNYQQNKKAPYGTGKIFENHESEKELIYKIYKELNSIERLNNLITK